MMKQIINKNILKLEKRLRKKSITLSVEDLKDLRILQLNKYNIENSAIKDSKDIKLIDIPHYKLAVGIINSANKNVMAHLIENYKKNQDKEEKEIEEKVRNFFSYFELFRTGKLKPKPAVLTRLKAGDALYIADGDHRSAFSLALQRPMKASILPFDLLFRQHWSKVQRNQMLDKFNYTLRLNDQILLPGNRDDMDYKMSLIPDHVIKGKNLIDITASFGMSAIAAREAGANSVTCVTESRDIAYWSNRFTFLSGNHSCIHIQNIGRKRDIDHSSSEFDTLVLNMESITAEQHMLLIKRLKFRYLVIELEPMKAIDDYKPILSGLNIKKQELIGRLSKSRKDPVLVREMWLIELCV